MGLFRTLKAITNHPLNQNRKSAALLDFLKWQLGTRLLPGPVVFNWVGGTQVIVRRGDHGMTQNLYCGLHDFHEMAYLLHVLMPQDLFVDIGANVGSYTLLACGAIGSRGHCFEPIPSTFANLTRNLAINQLSSQVIAHNLGLADCEGELLFTAGEDATNHVLSSDDSREGAISVPVRPLDSVLAGESPAFIKIDVEGFETPVLAGAERTLASPALHSVIMELNGMGQRYEYDEQSILNKMLGLGFSTYDYDPFSRKLLHLGGKNSSGGNTLFVRNIDRVKEILAQAPLRKIHSVEF